MRSQGSSQELHQTTCTTQDGYIGQGTELIKLSLHITCAWSAAAVARGAPYTLGNWGGGQVGGTLSAQRRTTPKLSYTHTNVVISHFFQCLNIYGQTN